MTETEQRQVELAISRLLLDTVFYADTRDYDRFAEQFTEAAVLHRPTSAEPLQGRAAIAAAYRKTPEGRANRHLISNVRVTIESAHLAHSIAYVTLFSTEHAHQMDEPLGAPVSRCLVGEFHDQWCLTESGWKVAERRAVFVMNQAIN